MKFANRWFIVGIGFLVLIVFGFGGYQIGRLFLAEPTANNLVNKKPQGDNEAKTSLGDFEELEGTPYLIAPVNSQPISRQNSYDKKASTTRNYLFVNSNDKSALKLVPGNNFLFLNAQEVVLERRDDKIVRGMWYEVV